MAEYILELKQIVDYPRCRIYRDFVRNLMNNRDIRVGKSCGLYYYTVLCAFVNFRTSYERIKRASYIVKPGEWICTVAELAYWFRTKTQRAAMVIMDEMMEQGLLTYMKLGHGSIIRYRIKDWAKCNRVLEYNAPCQKDTGFFFMPMEVVNNLIRGNRCSEMDALIDLWMNTVYNDAQVAGSETAPVVYMRNGSGRPLISYAELGARWGISKASAGILHDITTYRCIHREQLRRIYPNLGTKLDNLLNYLLKSGRIYRDRKSADIFFAGPGGTIDREMLAALWVYCDFAEQAEYRNAGEYPVKLFFFADGELYSVIYAAQGKEALLNCAVGENDGRKLVIVESVEQIGRLTLTDVAAYCLVDIEMGEIQYFVSEDTP